MNDGHSCLNPGVREGVVVGEDGGQQGDGHLGRGIREEGGHPHVWALA